MRDALRLAPITNTDLTPSPVTHLPGLRWLATVCCSCIRTHHDLLLLRGTDRVLEISQLMPVGLTIAVKGETLTNVATSKMDEASKPQSDLREGWPI